MRTPTLLASALALLILGGVATVPLSSARAEEASEKPEKPAKADQEKGLPLGKAPPAFRGSGFINCEPFDLASLRGKVVILQLSHTTSDPGREEVPRLHDLLEKNADKGLVVVVLFEERKSKIEKWVEETKATFPVVAGNRKMRDRFGLLKGFPTTYLLDVDGIIVWSDNFADRADFKLAEALRKVSKYPYVDPQFDKLREALQGQQFAAAAAELEKARAAAGEDATLVKELDAVQTWLDSAGDEELAAAAKLIEEGDIWSAHAKYVQIATVHKGLPTGQKASDIVLELRADKKTAREIDAGDFYAELLPEAQRVEKESGRKKAARVLKRVVSKYKGTYAAARAQELIDRLDPK